jgi:hypothetical protein
LATYEVPVIVSVVSWTIASPKGCCHADLSCGYFIDCGQSFDASAERGAFHFIAYALSALRVNT